MGFVNWFTDDPLGFKLPEGATLFCVSPNPMVKNRIEYLMTYWIDPEDEDLPENEPEKEE